jgi:hypothetical protein
MRLSARFRCLYVRLGTNCAVPGAVSSTGGSLSSAARWAITCATKHDTDAFLCRLCVDRERSRGLAVSFEHHYNSMWDCHAWAYAIHTANIRMGPRTYGTHMDPVGLWAPSLLMEILY